MRRRTGLFLASVVTLVIVVSLLLYHFIYMGVPLIDEWHCSKGDAPVEFQDGGRICLAEGSALPAGATWDPLGNRPYSCDGRRGWTVIHRGPADDCLRDGLELPEGWSK
jgi:hypothetical protein